MGARRAFAFGSHTYTSFPQSMMAPSRAERNPKMTYVLERSWNARRNHDRQSLTLYDGDRLQELKMSRGLTLRRLKQASTVPYERLNELGQAAGPRRRARSKSLPTRSAPSPQSCSRTKRGATHT